MAAFRHRALIVVVLCAIAGCTRNQKQPAAPAASRPGPNYSTVPCNDNCGRDPACQSSCTPINNQQPPPLGSKPFQ